MLVRILLGATALVGSGPAVAAWQEAKSRHFIIYSEQRPEELKRYAERLERFDQAVRVARGMEDVPLTDAGKLTVFVLRNSDAVSDILGARGSGIAGFYIAKASGPIAFVHRERTSSKFDLSSEAVFFHEYLHHLMLQDVNAALPSWVIEGFAEFFATARIEEDGSVILGHVPEYRSAGLFNLRALTIKEMLGGTNREIDEEEWELTYGKGWLLTHYLTFEKSRRNQLGRYLSGIQKGEPAIDAARAAFGDLNQLNRELEAYLRQKRHSGIVIPAEKLGAGPVTLRPLSAAEDAAMPVRMRNAIGFKKRLAERTADAARNVAADFPTSPETVAELAQAEFEVGRHEQALAAADHALAANPNLRKALIYKGRALMEIGRKDPAKTDWKAVRSWFTKANRLDPDDAEPLVRFYESFVAERVPATRNAVQGLMYAHGLVPQDYSVRMLVVRQLVVDGNFDGARRSYAPIAFNPHAGKARAERAKVIELLAAKNGTEAIALLDSIEVRDKNDD